MMHAPLSLFELIPPSVLGIDAVTAILSHANRITLGTEKGSLLVFDLSTQTSSSCVKPTATLISRHDKFSSKSIEQLGVVKELNALVCLTGGDVIMYTLSNLAPLSSLAPQTRSMATLFNISSVIHRPAAASNQPTRNNISKTISQNNPPQVHTTLAIACRRKLLLFSWVDGSWSAPQELSLPHQIRGMAFVNSAHSGAENSDGKIEIFAGFSTGEYGVISLQLATSKSAPIRIPALGELFALPSLEANTSVVGKASSSLPGRGGVGQSMGLGFTRGLGVLDSLSLGSKKLEKNNVVAIPQFASMRKGKQIDERGSNQQETHSAWLWMKSWGWDDDDRDNREGEVFVVRENIVLPLSATGRLRAEPLSSQAIQYVTVVDETLVIPPYVLSILPATPPPSSVNTSSSKDLANLPSLVVHSVDLLKHVQSLDIPPRTSRPDEKSPIHINTTAKLLTIASTVPQPPLLILVNRTRRFDDTSKSEQSILIGTMATWEKQVEDLGREGKWEESIRLLRRANPIASEQLPRPLLRKLASLHALELYKARRYEIAIDAFISLDISPAKVVALYPEKISGKLFLDEAGFESAFGGRPQKETQETISDEEESTHNADSAVVESKDADKQLHSAPNPEGRSQALDRDDTDSIKSLKPMPKLGLRGGIGLRRGVEANEPVSISVEEKHAKSEAKLFLDAVNELIRYLTDRRQKYAQALAALLPSARPSPTNSQSPSDARDLLAIPDLPLTSLTPEQLARVAQTVDTALFKSYLVSKPVMIGSLCRIENWCEVAEVEQLLLDAKKFSELLDLYNGKGMHEKAVKLLQRMSDNESDPEEKVGPTIRYLQKLGAAHLNLIFESSRWIFGLSPKSAMDIFTADLEEVETLPRHATMMHLENIGPDSCIAYLEHIIHHLGENAPEFHEKLIDLYLDQMGPENQNRSNPAYEKLLDLLEKSTAYRPERVLGRIPSDDMHKVRAILLGRLGRHEGALQIYVYQLDDHVTAEEYCKRVYETDVSMRPKIFHLLLRIYLRPRAGHPLMFAPALALIGNHASSIDAAEVFELLPPLVALDDIKVFLEKTLRRRSEMALEAKVIKAVAHAFVEQQKNTIVALEERRVKITESRLCPQCHKRLGNSVIAIHSPRGEVTHYQCREDFREKKR